MSAAEQDRDVAMEAVRTALDAIRAIGDPWAKLEAAGQFYRSLQEMADLAGGIRDGEVVAIWRAGEPPLARIARVADISKTRTHQIIQAAREEPVTEQAVRTKPEIIVAAIVTSPKGVLVGRRIDGKPLWTFIAGEHIDGESLEETAIREVKEETGLEVAARETLGQRRHPRTHRDMTYIAAEPTGSTAAIVGDADELAEVRWVSLAEADMLMGGTIFEPVHDYLRRTLKD